MKKELSWIIGSLILLFATPMLAGDYKLDPSPGLRPPPKLRDINLNSPPKLGGYEGLSDRKEEAEVVDEPESKLGTVLLAAGGVLIVLLAFKEAFS